MRIITLTAAVVASAALVAGGSAAATIALVSANPPVGTYSDGVTRECVDNTPPYTVHAHGGVASKACPAGSTLRITSPQKGPKGDQGPIGAPGLRGPVGAAGQDGAAGAKGDPGADAPVPAYGVGLVNISRGGGASATWAKASAPVVDVIGGTASNTFRMTCSAANAPCVIKAQAYATVAGVKAYPRLLIQKSSIDTGAPAGLCEYADGADNDGGTTALTTTPTDLPLGIGGSLDCGSAQVRPASGVVGEVDVPAGYYDIAATFAFTR